MIRRSSPAMRSVTSAPPSDLFQRLCAEYPDVSRRVLGEVLDRIQGTARGSPERARTDDVEISARRALDAIRARSAAAGCRVRHPGPVRSIVAGGAEDDVQSEIGADAVFDAFSPRHDLGAVSRFDRVSEAIRAQTRLPGTAPSANVLCRAAVTYLGVAAAAVSVPDRMLSASTVGCAGAIARPLEELQVVLGEGPSQDALAHGCAVLVADLADPDQQSRWPLYAPTAIEQGALGQYVLPMRLGAAQLGVFVLYVDHAAGLEPARLGEARIFAGIALDWLIDAMSSPGACDGTYELDRGPFVDDRPEIHQATGMVSVQLGVNLATALLRLRGRAFADDRSLSDLAADVVARTIRFRDGDRDDHDNGENTETP